MIRADRLPLAGQEGTDVTTVFRGAPVERQARHLLGKIAKARLILCHALTLAGANQRSEHTGAHR
jgi:hypothetical protein